MVLILVNYVIDELARIMSSTYTNNAVKSEPCYLMKSE